MLELSMKDEDDSLQTVNGGDKDDGRSRHGLALCSHQVDQIDDIGDGHRRDDRR